MKFQKLDPKQVPQVIALGVLSLGALGYAAVNFMGTPARSNSPAAAQQAKVQPASATTEPGAAAANTPGNGPEGTMAGNLTLPGQYNPDPFRAPASADEKKTPAPAPAPKFTPPSRPAPALPSVGREFTPPPAPSVPVVPPAPVAPPAPERPNVVVTGIIDVEGNPDMALVEFGAEQRIIQIGDQLSDYKVKKIGLDGIWLVHGKDRFFVALGTPNTPGAPGAPAATGTPAVPAPALPGRS